VTAPPSFQFTVDAIDTVPTLVLGVDFDNRGHQFLILDHTRRPVTLHPSVISRTGNFQHLAGQLNWNPRTVWFTSVLLIDLRDESEPN
jgi:hypothetical protein